jgi:Fe-S-cluster-containing hydrogenase component 2
MKVVRFLSEVDEGKCIGDKVCEKVCPTAAIKVVKRKAQVDEKRCVACFKCWDACREEAIRKVPRVEPLTIGLDPTEVDGKEINDLCAKAHLDPEQFICVCSGTLAREAAAAVVKGAKSPAEMTLMTGVRSGCGLYCVNPILGLLKARGVEITPPKGHRWYYTPLDLWDVPKEVSQKYPGFYLDEDKELFRKIKKRKR